ncbi:peptidase inhibitor [Streptomyces pratensis]|uniref:Peptidase inhibitor n=1 Tax=Streptomyces pratensis (strain ATCC 33331 / IAF-45CD) TaxID=591167 RepID=A0A8D4BJF7_STRFA
MQLKRIGTTLAGILALAVGGTLVNAAPAAAVGGCPSDKLCLYRSTEYRTLAFTAASTQACFWLSSYGMGPGTNGINSYVNNLPVKATIWNTNDLNNWYAHGTIRPGGYTSDTGAVTGGEFSWWKESNMICTGSAVPD